MRVNCEAAEMDGRSMHRKPIANRDRKRVLVVEDDAWIRWFMCDVLSDEGYEVIEAADGQTAIRLVDECSPHIVLLDIAMPGVTGVEVLRNLRSRRRTRTLPVVVVSAYPRVLTPDDEASVACVLNKPLQIERLLAAVREVLEPSESTDSDRAVVDPAQLLAASGLAR
jgi:two-component system phosphate regulon response regulator PhoB